MLCTVSDIFDAVMLYYLLKYIVFIVYYYLHTSYDDCVSVHVVLFSMKNWKNC